MERMQPEERTARVARAVGLVAMERNCTVREALAVLVDRAEREQRPLDEIALGVLEDGDRGDG